MKKKIMFSTVLLVCIFTVVVFASSFTVKISTKSSTTIELGNKVSLIVSSTNISGDGIGVIAGKLEYDKNVFEKVVNEDIKACSGWNSVAYNDINGNSMEGSFVTERTSGDIIKTDNELMEIVLKVKENATLGSTTVKITRN